jgi:tripartite-type tricarboxylate transporter receptor subunit TctC
MGVAPYQVEDFEWIVRSQNVPSYLFVKSDSPIKTFEDFVRVAKERELKIATAGYGTNDDIAIRFLASKGFKLVNVPFAKPAERYAAPLGGHVDGMYEEAGDVKQFLEAKQIRPIVIFAKKRNPAFPDVPASFELGYPVAFYNWRGVIAKKGVPPDRVKILADAFIKAMDSPKWKEFCKGEDCQADSTLGPPEFKKSVVEARDELLQFAKQYGLIKK